MSRRSRGARRRGLGEGEELLQALFDELLEEAEHAARAIKELANDLKRNPNSLLLGKESKP